MRERVSRTNILARTLGCLALCVRLGLVVYRRIAQSSKQDSLMSTPGDRDSLHRLINELRPEDVRTTERVLQALNASSDLLPPVAVCVDHR